MRIFSYLILFLFLSSMYLGSQFHKSHDEHESNRTIYNITNQIQWNETRFENQPTLANNQRLSNLVYKSLNYFGFLMFEFVKWGLEFGYNNYTTYNFAFLFELIKCTFFIVIGAALFPIFPHLLALIYLIYTGLKSLYKKLFPPPPIF